MRAIKTTFNALATICCCLCFAGCVLEPSSIVAVGSMFVWLFQSLWYLLAGWCYFLVRNLPRMDVQAEAVGTGIVISLLLAVGAHFLMRRLWNRPAQNGEIVRNWKLRQTLALVAALALLFVAGVATVGLTQQTAWLFSTREPITDSRGTTIRDAAASAHSANNLKLMGLAIHHAHDQGGFLPPAATFDPCGRTLHGWQVHLLPHMEKNDLYRLVDLTVPWKHPSNHAAFSQEVYEFRYAGIRSTRDQSGYAITTYAANLAVFQGGRPIQLTDLPRGTENTILAGEAAGNYRAWGSPLNVRDPKLGLQKSPDGFGGPSKRQTQFLIADGSVRTFTRDTDPEFLQLLAERGRD